MLLRRWTAPLAAAALAFPLAAAAEQIAPMKWDDPILGTLTSIPHDVNVSGDQTLDGVECDYTTVNIACVILNWPLGFSVAAFTNSQIRSNEGVRRRGADNSESVIDWAYIEITSFEGNHADGIQHEGGFSQATVSHTYIKMNPTPGQTAGLFAADNSTGHLQLDHVIFDGGPRGLVVACDGATSVGLNRVYFVNGSFDTAGYHLNPGMFTEPLCNGSGWTLTQWDDVWNADIVDGELVPTDEIPPPCNVPCIPIPQWGGGGIPDRDGDGVPNDDDICSLDADVPALFDCDSDLDGIGNACDGDLDGDAVVDFADIPFLVEDLLDGADEGVGSDMNCDGVVDFFDVNFFAEQLEAGMPGPSGLDCAGTPPCD